MNLFINYGIKLGASLAPQLQTRTRTGYTFTSCAWNYVTFFCQGPSSYPPCVPGSSNWLVDCYPHDPNVDPCDNTGQVCYAYQPSGFNSCDFTGWSAWTNTTSCTPATPGCSNNVVQRECRTIFI